MLRAQLSLGFRMKEIEMKFDESHCATNETEWDFVNQNSDMTAPK